MTPTEPALAVEQIDREAAAANILRRLIFQHGGEQQWMDASTMSMRMGEQDDHWEVQAFAAHRLAAQPRAAADREALSLDRIAQEYACEHIATFGRGGYLRTEFGDQLAAFARHVLALLPAPAPSEPGEAGLSLVRLISRAIDADLERQAGVQNGVEYFPAREDDQGVAAADMNIRPDEVARAVIAVLPTTPSAEVERAVEAERERCAKAAHDWLTAYLGVGAAPLADAVAAAIRSGDGGAGK